MASQMQFYRPTVAHINLDHLAHNVQILRNAIGENIFFCPMVKANAYGHGDVDVALRLQQEGVTTLGVGLIEEGQLLRQMGIQIEILVFGTFDLQGAAEILRQNLTPVISTWKQLELMERVLPSSSSSLGIHVKFDTGMHRLGFDWLEANKVFQYLNSKKNFFKVKGILTHLFAAEDSAQTDGKSFEQLQKFREVENIFAPMKPISHTLNSAGMLNFISMSRGGRGGLPGISLAQGVRPGLSIYGYSPLADPVTGIELKPVMSLRSQVIQIHQLNVGEGVSYGHSWKAGRKSIVGVVPIGYADGFHRILSNRALVLYSGQRVPVVGNVCMDHLIIDLTDAFSVQNQSTHEVTLFGYDNLGNLLPATEVALKSQSITWEILTAVGERVPRIMSEENSREFMPKKNIEVKP